MFVEVEGLVFLLVERCYATTYNYGTIISSGGGETGMQVVVVVNLI
jgi:hypothetical protein